MEFDLSINLVDQNQRHQGQIIFTGNVITS